MSLTRKKAIDLSIELWEWLAETGKRKWDWPEWEKYGEMASSCFLCEYDLRRDKGFTLACEYCPLQQRTGHPNCNGTKYWDWDSSITKQDRKLG